MMLTKQEELKVSAMFVPNADLISDAAHGNLTLRKKNKMTDIKTVTTQEELDEALAARSRYLRHPTQGGQVNSTDYEEDIDAAMKARIEEDMWSQ